MCVMGLSLPFPLQENQVYFSDFTAAWAQPCLRVHMLCRAKSESLHPLDKLTCRSVKYHGTKCVNVTAT